MKNLIIATAMLMSSFAVHAETLQVVPTFFWRSEAGGRYDCDGNRLHLGEAAVDFNVIPKGSVIDLGGLMRVVASDCGGRDVISRKAARERHCRAVVVDIWAPSKNAAMRMEEVFAGSESVRATFKAPGVVSSPARHHRHGRYVAAYLCQSSKPRHTEPAREEQYGPEEGPFLAIE